MSAVDVEIVRAGHLRYKHLNQSARHVLDKVMILFLVLLLFCTTSLWCTHLNTDNRPNHLKNTGLCFELEEAVKIES